MNRGRRAVAVAVAVAVMGLLCAARAMATPADDAAKKSAAELLPPSTLFYAEVDKPAELIRLIVDHPLRARLEQSPDYRKAFETPQFKEFRAVVEAVENKSGVQWRRALETGTGGGLVVAVDAATQGVVILTRSTDPEQTAKVRDAVFELARADAKEKGKGDPIESKEYRGISAWKAGESVIAGVGPWTVVSNKPKLAQSVADTLLDGGGSLADDVAFKAAREGDGADTGRSGWAFLRMPPLRLVAAKHPIFDASAKSDNPGAELLIGGLAGVVRNAPYVTASFQVREQGINLSVSAPHESGWVSDSRKFFFAPSGGGADKPLRPKGTLLSITTYRDLGAFWEAGPDLLTEGAAAQLAQTDSGFSTFLGGKSFGTDVLGSLAPQMQFVVAAQDYKAAGVHEPATKLPAGAIILRLKDKNAVKMDVRKQFRVAFQTIVAFANVDGASKGRPLLEMQSEKRGGADIMYAVYEAPGEGDAKPQAAEKKEGEMMSSDDDAHYNFSPALVVSGEHLMFCSTKQIAEELADLAAKQGDGSARADEDNTRVEISAAPIAELLRVNRDRLITQNMLEKGHSRAEAEKEIDVFVALVNAVREASVRLTPGEKTIKLELDVKLRDAK